ncbi:MAG: hypothetical protein FJW22_17085 [Acidimicrobiia bacterium]|nr:hypothetical protein [Acidimicrobiia bacterium]
MVLGVFLSGLTAVWPLLPAVVGTARDTANRFLPSVEVTSAIADGLAHSVVVGLVAAAVLIITPLALYVVFSDD